MKINLTKISTILLLLIVSFFTNYNISFGDIFTDAQAALDQAIANLRASSVDQCQLKLFDVYDLELAKFFDQIDTALKNKSSTSSLTNTLIIRYSNFTKTLREHFQNIRFSYSASQITASVSAAYIQCSGMTEEYITLAKNHMITQLKTNVVQKKSAIMLEKFNSINDRMADMNDQATEFYSFFQTFNNKLFGFVKKCVKG